jgi:hypothetical protein
MGQQPLIALPHLATLGIGFDADGVLMGDTKPVLAIAIVHLVSSMVLAAGGLLHSLLLPGNLEESEVAKARKFNIEWDNPDKLTFILGHHLIILGFAVILLVEWARVHGVYDPAIGAVRQVEYDLNLAEIWNHQTDIHGFETLEKLGFHDWGFDYVLLDFLGDVVCGGFGLPIARDMCQKVIVVASNDLQSLYVANNVCSAVEYFRRLGGNVGVAGMVINKDDGTGEAQNFTEKVGIPVLAAIPANEDIRRKSASYEIIGKPDSEWGSLFGELAANVASAPPVHPNHLIRINY